MNYRLNFVNRIMYNTDVQVIWQILISVAMKIKLKWSVEFILISYRQMLNSALSKCKCIFYSMKRLSEQLTWDERPVSKQEQ